MHHFNPVPVRIQNEHEEIHLSVLEVLFEQNAKPLEAHACRLDVGHSDGNVAEPLRLLISRAVWCHVKGFCAMVCG